MTPINEVDFEREYNASVNQVWKALTDPAELKQWWGSNFTSIPECEVDLRVGGRFYIVMKAGEEMGPYVGTLWPMEAIFTVVDANSKLYYKGKAWTKGKEDTSQIEQVTEINLADEGGKTKLTAKATINSAGPDAAMAVEGMRMGFNQALDKLEAFLAK